MFFSVFARMSSIRDCDLIDEDLLLWQMLGPMITGVNFSLHWVVQMNLTTSTQSLERSAVWARMPAWVWTETTISFSVFKGCFSVVCCYIHLKFISLLSKLFLFSMFPMSNRNVCMGCSHNYILCCCYSSKLYFCVVLSLDNLSNITMALSY